MNFYERVKALVKQQGKQLLPTLESVGINYETYKSAKRVGNLPRTNDSVAIAKALGTTVEYLVTGEISDSDKITNDTIDNVIDTLACLKKHFNC